MNWLIACYQCNNLGGIINHTEQLAAGLIGCGDTVKFCYLHPTSSTPYRGRAGTQSTAMSYFRGLRVDQGKGWLDAERYAYATLRDVDRFRRYAEEFDVVLFTVPTPPRSAATRGIGTNWLKLYDLLTADVLLISHDGNLRKTYPHITALRPYARHLVCVHPCAYNNAKGTGFQRHLIYNPQQIPEQEPVPWGLRRRGWVAPHNFKAWKRMGDLIGSCRYQRKYTRKIVFGGGIEYNYMTSATKCKEEYIHTDGMTYWDAAVENDLDYRGFASHDKVLAELSCMKLLIDPSWSKSYAAAGGHFNRSLVDAMLQGALPCARPDAAGDEVLRPLQHYIPLPPRAAGIRALAETIEATMAIDADVADRKIRRNFNYAKRWFNRRTIAEEYRELVFRNPTSRQYPSDELQATGQKVIEQHYGG